MIDSFSCYGITFNIVIPVAKVQLKQEHQPSTAKPALATQSDVFPGSPDPADNQWKLGENHQKQWNAEIGRGWIDHNDLR
jgi:hypothetical protein